jgi:hypothetical protein
MKRLEKAVKVKDGRVKKKTVNLNDGYAHHVDVNTTLGKSSIKKHKSIIITQVMY